MQINIKMQRKTEMLTSRHILDIFVSILTSVRIKAVIVDLKHQFCQCYFSHAIHVRSKKNTKSCTPTLQSALPGPGCVFCWTYSSSADNMTWTEARNFCRTNYTDLVAIQNTDETEHLLNITHIIPHRVSTPHYWIGIRKIKGTWTWVGMNKSMTGNGSWAPNEPNSVDGEDCVEIYINQENKKGKWNDINCAKKNFAICYKGKWLKGSLN